MGYVLDPVIFMNEVSQIDKKFNTGEVNISLDKSKSANYIIKYPCAWDKIQVLDNYIEVVENSDFFVFGSLISRDEIGVIPKTVKRIYQNKNPIIYGSGSQKRDFIFGLSIDTKMKF